MKKYAKILIVAVIVIIIAVILLKVIAKPEYTLEDVKNILNTEISNNIHFSEEVSIFKENIEEKDFYEILRKDNELYELTMNVKEIFDYENKKEIRINEENKKIEIFKIQNYDEKNNPLVERLNMHKMALNSPDYKYKYIGKEDVEGKECIKIEMSTKTSKSCYYVDINAKTLLRIEHYTKLEDKFVLSVRYTFTYSYNTVTETDIPVFDANNYPDYEIIEME